MTVGDVYEQSGTIYIWRIESFPSLTKCFNYFLSPSFQFKGHYWFLQCNAYADNSNSEDSDDSDDNLIISFQIIREQKPLSNPCTLTHRMCIRYINGQAFWITRLRNSEFSSTNNSVKCYRFRQSDFMRNKSRIIAQGFLYISLTLDLSTEGPTPPREEVNILTKAGRSAADMGTQTYPELESEPRCSSFSDGGAKVLKNLNDLLLSGQKSDLTFNVRGTAIKAHKNILLARSPVFEKMFAHEMVEETTGSVEITDCEPEDFRAFLLYLYAGKVEKPTVESAVELYCLADKYCIEDLGPHCVQFLLGNLTVESFCDILPLALRYCETELIDSASTFFHENMKKVVGTPKWKVFNKENPDGATEILMKSLS